MGTIYNRNPRMEQVDMAMYRATLLAKTRRKIAEAEGKRGETLERSEVEAIVREAWHKWENLLNPEENTGEEFERRGHEIEAPDFLRRIMERR